MMHPSALQHDHTKTLAKPRTCYIVAGFDHKSGDFKGIYAVRSNDIKARKWIAENNFEGIQFTVQKEAVL